MSVSIAKCCRKVKLRFFSYFSIFQDLHNSILEHYLIDKQYEQNMAETNLKCSQDVYALTVT